MATDAWGEVIGIDSDSRRIVPRLINPVMISYSASGLVKPNLETGVRWQLCRHVASTFGKGFHAREWCVLLLPKSGFRFGAIQD